MEIYPTLFKKYGNFEWGGTGLLVIANKVKIVAWAYEYQAGSD